MAAGNITDFKVYDPFFHAGVTETIRQNLDAFNAASAGTIQLNRVLLPGETNITTKYGLMSGLVSRRDDAAATAVTDSPLTRIQEVSVKLKRRIGPIADTYDAFKAIARDPNEMSLIVGQQAGVAIAQDYLDTILSALVGSMVATTDIYNDATTAGTITTASMVDTMKLRGDRAGEIAMWVMHSKQYYDLVKEQIAANIFEVGGFVVHEGSPVTFGKPVLVTDSASLINTTPTPDAYYALGLAPGAAVVEESEGRTVISEPVTGFENLLMRVQAEHAYNIGIAGFEWDTTNGGTNPNAAAVALGTNWDQTAADVKDLPGVILATD